MMFKIYANTDVKGEIATLNINEEDILIHHREEQE